MPMNRMAVENNGSKSPSPIFKEHARFLYFCLTSFRSHTPVLYPFRALQSLLYNKVRYVWEKHVGHG
jgi:hypothetical protein